jgi:hypothetical protein
MLRWVKGAGALKRGNAGVLELWKRLERLEEQENLLLVPEDA